MSNSHFNTLCPLDGRYSGHLGNFAQVWSELGLMKKRIQVEIEWLITITSHPEIFPGQGFQPEQIQMLRRIGANFSAKDLKEIKKHEIRTEHDIKALEQFLRSQVLNICPDRKNLAECIHFGITSDDINNLSYALMLRQTRDESLLPNLKEIEHQLIRLAHRYSDCTMLGRTHGQAAVPTTVGKEMANFAFRLQRQLKALKNQDFLAKFNGAVGNYSALYTGRPGIDWQSITGKFINSFDLIENPYTTQIEPHDYVSEFFDNLARINTILLNLSRDIWLYMSQGYLSQQFGLEATGSSTMPHKSNPINFENAEGNLGLANALFNHFSSKLPCSRLQRDLSDSTVMRNFGVGFGYALVAYRSLIQGLKVIVVQTETIREDLNRHYEVLGEAIQTVMRAQFSTGAFDNLRSFSKGKILDRLKVHNFIKELNLSEDEKNRLLKLTPESYIGLAYLLAENIK